VYKRQLLWSLGLGEIGPIDRQHEDPRALAEVVGYLEPDATSMLDRVRVRELDELEAYAEEILNVHWRLRDFSLHDRGYDCRNLFAATLAAPLPGVTPVALLDDDLALGGSPLVRAERDVIHTTTSITMERQHAANWLVGQAYLYADISLDT
jgi:hypothetical protein